MGFIFNEDTAVPQDDIIQQQQYDEYMNSNNLVGRSQQIQTKPWSHDFDFNSISSPDTLSYTTTEDIIITSIVMNLSGEDNAAQDAEIHFCIGTTTNKIITIRTSYHINGQSNNTAVVPIPNWDIKAGTVLIGLGDRSGGNNHGAISVIGYTKN